MDLNIAIKQERGDNFDQATTFSSHMDSTILRQPTNISNTVSSNPSISTYSSASRRSHLSLDIKPNIDNLEMEEDDGQITPPVPRLIVFPTTTTTEDEDKENAPRPPVQSCPQSNGGVQGAAVEYPLDSFMTRSTSVPNFMSAYQEQMDAMNDQVLSLECARDLQRKLDETRYNFFLHKKKSMSVANMLNTGLQDLQRNIKEIWEDTTNLSAELGISNSSSSNPSTPINVRDEACQTEDNETDICAKNNGNSNLMVIITEDAMKRLEGKMKDLHERSMEKFKKIETRRGAMLTEIKKTNEKLSKFLNGSILKFNRVRVPQPLPLSEVISPIENKEATLIIHDAGPIILTMKDLNLNQDWVEEAISEYDPVEGDYDRMIFKKYWQSGLNEERAIIDDLFEYPHKERANKNATAPGPSILHERDENKTGYFCKCGTSFRLYTSLWNHTLYKNQPRFECDRCDKHFFKHGEIISHMRKSHNVVVQDRFICYSCDKRFVSSLEMFKHKGSCPVLNGNKKKVIAKMTHPRSASAAAMKKWV